MCRNWLFCTHKLNKLVMMNILYFLDLCRCPWVVLLWLLYSCQGVSFRFKEWSSLHSRQSYSPLRCRVHRWDHLDLLTLQSLILNASLCLIHHLSLFFSSVSMPFYTIILLHSVNPPPSFKVQGSDSEDSQDSSDSGVTAQKTREILARRPSYR